MAELGAGTEAGLQQHGGEAGASGTMHLHQLKAGFGFQDQQQPQRQNTHGAGGIAHQFQGGLHRAPHPQSQHPAGGGGGQQAAPGASDPALAAAWLKRLPDSSSARWSGG